MNRTSVSPMNERGEGRGRDGHATPRPGKKVARAIDHHINLRPNWTSRGSPGPPEARPATGRSVLKIWPKLDDATSRCGMSKLARFKRLKTSVRISSLLDSERRKFLIAEKSQLLSFGPVRMSLPALPKVNGAGAVKAVGRTYRLGVLVTG